MYRLKIKNIGKIKEADVQIGGLTVLTGYNDVGKSTIGKVLWSVIHSINSVQRKANSDMANSLGIIKANFTNYQSGVYDYKFEDENFLSFIAEFEMLLKPYRGYEIFYSDEFKTILKNLERMRIQVEKDTQHPLYSNKSDSLYRQLVDRSRSAIKKIFQMADDLQTYNYPIELAKETFTDILCIVFSWEIMYEANSEISFFYGKPPKPVFEFTRDSNESTKLIADEKHPFYYKDATYIESPIILNFKNFFNYNYSFDLSTGEQKFNLASLPPFYNDFIGKIESVIYKNNPIKDNPLSLQLIEKIQEIISGTWEVNQFSKSISFVRNQKYIPSFNVASGIKAFGMLQLLAESGCISEDSVLILDEPESHLHPEWEIKYAELLVWMALMGIPIVVSTHSTYIMDAIIRFAEKQKAEHLVSYYIGEEEPDGSGTVFTDVTDNVPELFKKNAIAMQKLYLM